MTQRKRSDAERQEALVRSQEAASMANQILENPLFTRTITGMIAGNIQNWRDADPADTHEMQRYHALDGFLREFRDTFEAISIKGEDARKEMSRLVSGQKVDV